MKPKIELRQMRDFGEIINDTFTFAQQNWKPLLRAYVVICGFFIVAGMALSIVQQTQMMKVMSSGFTSGFSSLGRIYTPEYFLLLFFSMLSYSMLFLVTYSYMALYQSKGNEAPNVEEVWGYVKYYFFRVTWATLLVVLLNIVGFVLCLVPGFWLWPIMSLVIPVMVIENTTFGYAFNYSFKLIKGNFWLAFGVLFIVVIIAYACMMILILPIQIFSGISMFTTGFKLSKLAIILTSIATHISQVFYVLPGIAIIFTYFSLTEIKDGTGLMSRIDMLGKKGDNTDQLSTEEY